ncbi:paraquat-inducible protein A [Iodobacter fluviatilis]|uniref:Inner membrane protein yebS n=1 Tax=Iodobacter fluviatilis TaxID=537 RepID=A0A377Q3R1_9NEIS|nr:paraquat-inducible protein A [Iodobacter fluviatilis]TCU82660.1 paraquat-inducible protein A [Iodobacter fluviatilis]STQ89854.1 Inner membrane protein yebS [Iodobacter fluviatilis]
MPAHELRCAQCDLLQNMDELHAGQGASCVRCGHHLCSVPLHPFDTPLAYALTTLILLILSCAFPLLNLHIAGVESQMTFLSSAKSLVDADFGIVANVLLSCVLLTPALFLCAVIYLSLALKWSMHWPGLRSVLRLAIRLEPWMMADVFVIGILVSLIKLAALAQIGLGLSFWAMLLFSLSLIKTVTVFDVHWFGFQLDHLEGLPAQQLRMNGAKACTVCGFFNGQQALKCERCHARLYERRPHSLAMTWALLITAMLLYLPANLYPMMITESLGERTPSTILEGVLLLWRIGSYPVATIIFVASVVVPLVKFISIVVLCIAAQSKSKKSALHYTRLYRITELIGRWSMVDVFVVVILVALIHMGKLMSVFPGVAAVSFAGVVVFTMLSALSFDVRLIWDAQSRAESESRKL